MHHNVAALVSYALYLCTQSHMMCEPAMRDVKAVDGIAHYEIRYGEQSACQRTLEELTKTKTLASNQWYECRAEKAQ